MLTSKIKKRMALKMSSSGKLAGIKHSKKEDSVDAMLRDLRNGKNKFTAFA